RGRSRRYHPVGLGYQRRLLGGRRDPGGVYRHELGIFDHTLHRGGRLWHRSRHAADAMMSLLDLVRGATFDDFLFNPQYSVVERRDPNAVDLTCRFSTGLTLKRPIVSANMDTITRSEMALAVAEEGGIGIIDRGFRSGEIEPQVREVEIVKRKQHGIIADPYTIPADASLS